MIKTVLLIFLYSYIIGMTGVLLYYLYLYWYVVSTAREYDMQLDNCVATIALWLLVPKEKVRIEYIIIMSTHPDIQDDKW